LVEIPLNKSDIQKIEKEENQIRNAKLALERKKQEEEREAQREKLETYQQMVKSGDNYFENHKLFNKDEIQIDISNEVLPILYEYFQEFRNNYEETYNLINDNYVQNMRYSALKGENPDDYVKYDLNIYFNKNKTVDKITVSEVRGGKEITLSKSYLDKLQRLIKINVTGQIEIDSELYPVNSKYSLYFTPKENIDEYNIILTKKRNGQISFKEDPGFDKQTIYNLLNDNKEIERFEKGDFKVKIIDKKVNLRLTHFNNNSDIITIEKPYESIKVVEIVKN
jgi:hypothetical protein